MRRGDRGPDPTPERLVHTIELKNRDGQVVERREVVALKGLLRLAHRERLSSIRTRLVQAPTKDNDHTAIAVVAVVTSRGTFEALGDATPSNVNRRVAAHFIRMAETRALARALRAALDIGVVSLEELEEIGDDVTFDDRRRPAAQPPGAASANDAEPAEQPAGPDAPRVPDRAEPPLRDVSRASEQQRRFLYRLLADRDITGDRAREYIRERLGVSAFADASKAAVSRLIDEIRQGNGIGGHPEPPAAA
ncbi:MAG: hypothetical protein IT379_14980 [Deltaproteobacteria bacterium]|nr:hypothetical protein [Deltaproteobacteria bacterium]